MRKLLGMIVFIGAGFAVQQSDAQIKVTSIGSADPSSLVLDVDIDGSGVVSTTSTTDFSVTGSNVLSGAFGGTIGLFIDAMNVVDTSPSTLGNKLEDGVINCASDGSIGVNGGAGGGVEVGEGLIVYLDKLTNIDPSVRVQLIAFELSFMGAGEECTVVNPQTRKSLSFTANGSHDVSSLNLWLKGGESGAAAMLYHSGTTGNYRMNSITLDTAESGIRIISTSSAEPGTMLDLSLSIDGSGNASAFGSGYTVEGMTPTAFGSTIGFAIDAIKNVDTNSATLGDKLVDGNIDRNSSGQIGVSGDPSGGGISQDGTSREGLALTVTEVNSAVQLKVSTITVGYLNTGESFKVVNLATRDFLEFNGSGSTYPAYEFDVSSLNLKMNGGVTGAVATIISGDSPSNFNVSGVLLETVRSEMVVTSIATNSGASTFSFDLDIDGTGDASISNSEFSVAGFCGQGGTFDGSVSITLDAVQVVDTNSATLGDKLVDGSFWRDPAGAIGVDSGGFDVVDGAKEGMIVSFDELAGIDPLVRVKITSVGVLWLRRNESITVVNLQSGESYEYWGTFPTFGLQDAPTQIDVSNLDLGLWGGQSGAVASLFAQSDNAGYLIQDITFEVLGEQPIVITSTDGSEPGSTLALDVLISNGGTVTTTNSGMTASGLTRNSGAFNGVIGLTIDAMKNVDTTPATLGDKLVDGDIERNSSGHMGVVGDPSGGGISQDATNREGLQFVFDELTGIDSTVQVKIIGIKVGYLNTGESCTMVNLATRETLEFNGSSSTYPEYEFDVSSLNIGLSGGASGAVASIISGDSPSNFNVISLTLELASGQISSQIVVVDANTIQLIWGSGFGEIYKVQSTTSLADIGFADLAGHTGIASGGAMTTNTVDISSMGTKTFFKVINE